MDENFNSLKMECTNCHLNFVATELKLDQSGDSLVCSNCFTMPGSRLEILSQPKKKAAPRVLNSPFPDRQPGSGIIPKPAIPSTQPPRTLRFGEAGTLKVPSGHKAYKCNHCRYEFTRKADWKGNCPYCSKVGMLKMLKGA